MATKTNTEINGTKYYRITRTIGHEIIDGKKMPIKKQFYGLSKTAALKKYYEWKEEQLRIEYEKTAYIRSTFGELAKEYVDNVLSVSSKYAKGTIVRYKSSYNTYVKDSFLSDMMIGDVQASTIQKFYNELDVSEAGLKSINKFMSGFYKWMLRNGYSDNVLLAVELPKKDPNKRKNDILIWEDDEIEAILKALDDAVGLSAPHRQYFLVFVLLYTGMRISEALSLRYSDIRDDVIYVDRQYYMGEMKPPKYGSKRQIPMHEELKRAFQIHKAWHEQEMVSNGYETDYVFTTSSGQLYHVSSVHKALMRFYKKIGVPYKSMHTYRATFCTQLCRCGVPLEVASKLLGHKSMEVTAKHYALVRQETQRDAISKLTYRF